MKRFEPASILKASEVLGVAPSSVSRHIAILEAQIGLPCSTGALGGLEITHAGQLVADTRAPCYRL